MYSFGRFNIPFDLINRQPSEDDISILIGENGSGKSTLLSYIADSFSGRPSHKVIAIANTIHDKFKAKSSKVETLKASTGKTIVTKTLIRCLAMLSQDDLKRVRNIGNTLEYVGFEPYIGFTLKGLKYNFESILDESNLDISVKTELKYCLEKYQKEYLYSKKTAKVSFQGLSFDDIKDILLITLFKYEGELRKMKLIKGIDLFLYKGIDTIPVHQASSGELTLITSLLYITSSISYDSVILIDEPENSLHPKWQIEYVKRLSELFYLYQPKIIIATHSPLIINGGELHSNSIKIYKGIKGEFRTRQNDTNNVEEIYHDYFDVTTPQNRYLSELLVKKMNELASKDITLNEFETT